MRGELHRGRGSKLAAALSVAASFAWVEMVHAYEVPKLAEVSTLTATSSGSLEVELTRPVKVFYYPTENPSIEIEGAGPITGFRLLKLPVPTGDDEGVTMVTALRADPGLGCAGRSCGNDDGFFVFGSQGFDGSAYEMPAGRYALSAITTTSPVRIRLRLPELAGTGTLALTPTAPLASHIEQLESRPSSRPGTTLFAGAHELGHRGMFYIALRGPQDAAVAASELCFVRGRADFNSFEPGCAGSFAGTERTVDNAEADVAVTNEPAGPYSLGGNVTGATGQVRMVAAWVPHAPLPPSVPSPAAPPATTSTEKLPRLAITVRPRQLSARAARRHRRVDVRFSTRSALRGLTVRLLSKRNVVASARLARLHGTRRVTLRLSGRLAWGRAVLLIDGTDEHGRRGQATRTMRVRR